VTPNEETIAKIRAGRPVNLLELSSSKQVKVYRGQLELIAIVNRVAGTLFHPKIVLIGQPEMAGSGHASNRPG